MIKARLILHHTVSPRISHWLPFLPEIMPSKKLNRIRRSGPWKKPSQMPPKRNPRRVLPRSESKKVSKHQRFGSFIDISPTYFYLFVFLDLTELELPSTMTTHFPDPTDLLNFTLTINPDEGLPKLPAHIFSNSQAVTYPIPLRFWLHRNVQRRLVCF